MHPTIRHIPTSLLGSHKTSGRCVRGGGGMQEHCQQRLNGTGQPTRQGGHSLVQAPHVGYRCGNICLKRHQSVHTGQSRNGMEKERAAGDPEDLGPGGAGLQLAKHWHLRWVMDKWPVFIQYESHYFQRLSFTFTRLNLTNLPFESHGIKKRAPLKGRGGLLFSAILQHIHKETIFHNGKISPVLN